MAGERTTLGLARGLGIVTDPSGGIPPEGTQFLAWDNDSQTDVPLSWDTESGTDIRIVWDT